MLLDLCISEMLRLKGFSKINEHALDITRHFIMQELNNFTNEIILRVIIEK